MKVQDRSQLFNPGRLRIPNLFRLIIFLIWLPIGVILGLPLYGIAQRFHLEPWVLMWALPLMGLICITRNGKRFYEPSLPKILVMNHRTDHDFLYFYNYGPFMVYAVTPFMHWVCNMVRKIGVIVNSIDVREGHNTSNPDEDTKLRIKNRILNVLQSENQTLAIAPEGATTNGKGLLQFNRHIFSLGYEIQPVALRVWHPINVGVVTDHLFDNSLANIFFISYQPINIYEYTMLERTSILPNETPEDFADRVQKMIAKELNIEATRYTWKDKIEYRKELVALQNNKKKSE